MGNNYSLKAIVPFLVICVMAYFVLYITIYEASYFFSERDDANVNVVHMSIDGKIQRNIFSRKSKVHVVIQEEYDLKGDELYARTSDDATRGKYKIVNFNEYKNKLCAGRKLYVEITIYPKKEIKILRIEK